MQLYQCKVRLNSQPNHEVQKTGVTVSEIIVLRHLHSMVAEGVGGYDPVIDIKLMPGKTANRNDRQERDRLHGLYGLALKKSKEKPSIDAIFGVGTPLPKITEGMGLVEVDEPIEHKRLGRPPKVQTDPLAELS